MRKMKQNEKRKNSWYIQVEGYIYDMIIYAIIIYTERKTARIPNEEKTMKQKNISPLNSVKLFWNIHVEKTHCVLS